MEPKYKEFIIRGLYGLIEGSASSLEFHLESNFKLIFGFQPESITVTHKDKFVGADEKSNGCWIGEMTIRIVLEGEEFSVTRDWGEEYEHDTNHPDYNSDDYFYESDKCFSYKKCNELLESISPKGIAKDRLKNF